MKNERVIVTPEEIQNYRADLLNNIHALADIDLIEDSDGDLEYSALRLARRSSIERVRHISKSPWEDAINQARELLCHDGFKVDLAPNVLGGLVGILTASGNPILAAVATPLAIYIIKESLEIFCD
jgi:hypothetical protein